MSKKIISKVLLLILVPFVIFAAWNKVSVNAEAVNTFTITVNVDSNVRIGPGRAYRAIGIAAKGTELVAVEKSNNGWYKVVYNNVFGYKGEGVFFDFLNDLLWNITDWAGEFLKRICVNRRRVFQASEIFAEGAAYAAFDLAEENSQYPYIIVCDGRIASTVTLEAICDGRNEKDHFNNIILCIKLYV